MEEQKKKPLNRKQKEAINYLTCGKGLTQKEVSELIDIGEKQVSCWMTQPQFQYFRDALAEAEKNRWESLTDEAIAAASDLIKDRNPKIVEYILKCSGHNPVTKVEAEVKNSINLTIE